ncbi:MAG: hypothetical protein IIC54_13705 [Proteobacteria bacterium]|nr:hypothetical protein [Pseudomonadota bacterium]
MGRALAGLVAAALVHSAIAGAAGGKAAGDAETYVHPLKKFTLRVPVGARVIERGTKFDVVIQSPSGYVINVQSGAVNADVSLMGMTARLEATYLGDGKRWSRRLEEGSTTVGGLSARAVLYEGPGMRTRVVVARGRETDFVFMFIAPPGAFDGLVAVFDRVLASFRPAAAEVAVRPGPPPPAAPARPPVAPLAAARHFADPEFGFSIDYPRQWIVARPSAHTVTFSGRQGTEAFYAVVSIQNVEPPSARDSRQAAAAVVSDLKSQWAAGATDVGYFNEGPITYENNGLRLHGHQFLVAYTQGGQRFKQWTVVVSRPAGTVVHVWSYTAPDGLFRVFQPVAEAMRKTWAIHVR